MHALNLRISLLGVLLACMLVACSKPISTQQADRGIDDNLAKMVNRLYQEAEVMHTQSEYSGNPILDAAMNREVKLAILAEFGLRVLDMDVQTIDQVVTLSGTIDSRANSHKAMQIANAVSGVKLVENRLIVKPLVWG